jgi:glycosyltransferase involved in cell wall biosynthesis
MDDFRGPKGGGTEVQFINLLEALDRDRVNVEIAVLRESSYTKALNDYPYKLETLNIKKILSVKTLIILTKLARRIRRERIKIVHIFFNDASIIAPFFCKLGGAKVVVARRDLGFWYTRFNLLCLFISNLFVDRMIVNSNAIKQNVHIREKYPLEKITVIYNGINSSRFANLIRGGFRERSGISRKDPIIGIVANLDKIKRHRDLIDAFSMVLNDFPNAKLVFAGHGPEEGNLRKMLHDKKIEHNTFFLGNVDDVQSVIIDLDICVLCSESEGLSNAIIEYMGCGKPVICTNVGGNPELIQEGVNGYLVNVGDVDGIVGKLIQLLSNRELLKKLGENARTSFAGKFNIDEMVRSHTEVYASILCPK